MITTVFFPKEADPGYRKAMVNSGDVKFFLGLGAKETPEFEEPTFKEPVGESYVEDPQVGCGRPGSMEWHTASINQAKNNRAIADYVFETTGKGISNMGKRDSVKKRALKVLREYHDND